MYILLKKKLTKIMCFLGLKKSHLAYTTYSQTGEDIIINFIFNARGISYPSYLDIGAFHPYELSNTYFFYKKGSKGINIEPNPNSIQLFEELRPFDINLNIGIGASNSVLKFYA